MATINFTLQGKGGVGKSFISSVLAQYLLSKGIGIACFDTDPINATFAEYTALGVQIIDLMDGDSINTRNFDELIEQLMQMPDDAEAVVDNGAATFVPLGGYLSENDIPAFLKANGHSLRINTIIAGGEMHGHTMQGLNTLLKTFPTDVLIAVWLNPFWGKTDFTETALYRDNASRFEAVIELPARKKETFGYDIMTMLSKKLTFDEAIQNPAFALMAKQRLKTTQKDCFELLSEAGF